MPSPRLADAIDLRPDKDAHTLTGRKPPKRKSTHARSNPTESQEVVMLTILLIIIVILLLTGGGFRHSRRRAR